LIGLDQVSCVVGLLTKSFLIEALRSDLTVTDRILPVIRVIDSFFLKRYHSRTAVSLVNDFKRDADIFFGPEPDTVFFKLKRHKRAWILQALKRFGDCWKYNSREVQKLVKTTIERYMLNRDLDMKDKIYLVNPNYLQRKINALMAIPGEIGFTVRMGLFTGLREEELYYIHDKEICCNEIGCKCNNLHPINVDRNTGITIIGINWVRGNKKAFATILPTKMWEQFRRITKFDRHDIVAAHSITKRDVDILYMGVRKIHYNVMRFKDTMTADETDALAGRAKTVAAQHYVLHDLQLFAGKYVKAWNNVGLNIFNIN
jgi:intergrase/recombinase